jgi:O-acetyl-ADP-ribose deacetylase (regulator of RNase III)/uncharacterized protein YwgA
MIEFAKGNLLKADVEALVNTVNCVGAMGKGIALQFKKAFPENYKLYKKYCDQKKLVVGKMFITCTHSLLNPKYIINFPTKAHWKGASRLEYVEQGLIDLVAQVQKRQIRSLAVPPLGCGLGGLDWHIVSRLVCEAFRDIQDVTVYLYEPLGSPQPKTMPVQKKDARMTRARALYLQIMTAYKGPDYSLGMLEIQKLAYFLQESGEPLKLRFVKNTFGPYADNLHHTLQNIEGPMIVGYGDRIGTSEIQPRPEAVTRSRQYLQDKQDAVERLKRVIRLIRRFETPYGLELLSTVHWAIKNSSGDINDVVDYVYSWNDRKKKLMTKPHIHVAWKRIKDLAWE